MVRVGGFKFGYSESFRAARAGIASFMILITSIIEVFSVFVKTPFQNRRPLPSERNYGTTLWFKSCRGADLG